MGRTRATDRVEDTMAVVVDRRRDQATLVRSVVLRAALVMTGVGLLTASAWVSVPFYPVPMTLQTLAVLLVGGLLGPRMGVAAVTSYLALGLAGAPVFHNGIGGLVLLVGPTGGYLWGFVPAVLLMGVFGLKGWAPSAGRAATLRKWAMVVSGAVLAEMAIYSLGLPWLAFVTGADAGTAIAVGFVPFMLGDLVKTCIAVVAVCGGKNLLDRWGYRPL